VAPGMKKSMLPASHHEEIVHILTGIMKRSQLIQIAIIAVALLFGYKAIESITVTLITLLYEFGDRGGFGNSFILQYLVLTAIYFLVFFLSIRYNRQIAAYIDKGQANTPVDSEKVNIVLEQRSVLFIVIIAICLAHLLEEIPVLIVSIYKSFKREAGSIPFGSETDISFKNTAVKFVFTLIILLCARPISDWFNKQLATEKPVIETPNES
jgi:hypothetical protein